MITDPTKMLADDREHIKAMQKWDTRFQETCDKADAERDRPEFLRMLAEALDCPRPSP